MGAPRSRQPGSRGNNGGDGRGRDAGDKKRRRRNKGGNGGAGGGGGSQQKHEKKDKGDGGGRKRKRTKFKGEWTKGEKGKTGANMIQVNYVNPLGAPDAKGAKRARSDSAKRTAPAGRGRASTQPAWMNSELPPGGGGQGAGGGRGNPGIPDDSLALGVKPALTNADVRAAEKKQKERETQLKYTAICVKHGIRRSWDCLIRKAGESGWQCRNDAECFVVVEDAEEGGDKDKGDSSRTGGRRDRSRRR